MATQDLMNVIKPVVAAAPQVVTDGSAVTTVAIDTKGYQSLTFVIALGTLVDADATWSVMVKHGDDSTVGNHAAVDDTFLIGDEATAAFDFAADGKCRKIGYKGSKRYVSLVITNVTANTGAFPVAVLALLGHPDLTPTANPPV